MAEETLLKTLEEDARNQAAGIIEEAERRAREIIDGARSEAASLKEARLSELSAALGKERSALLNSARVKASGALLEVRRAVIDSVLEGVVESYREMPEQEYAALLKRLCSILKKDLAADSESAPVIRVNPADLGKLGNAGVEVAADPSVSLGVVYASADGKVRKVLTIPSIISKTRKTLETEIDRTLFGKEG